MLLVLTVLLQQITVPEGGPDTWFQYGLAGALVFLMILILKYIVQRDKADTKERMDREEKLAGQRSELYRADNKIRDERWIKSLEGIVKTLETVDVNGSRFIEATNTTIDKFVQLVNKVMEQSNYQTQILTELKVLISKLPSDFESVKKELSDNLKILAMNYDPKTKKEG